MTRSPEELLAGVAALRPWPFGPPLRGRAEPSDASHRAARSREATAPAGGLACPHPP